MELRDWMENNFREQLLCAKVNEEQKKANDMRHFKIGGEISNASERNQK